MAKEEPGRVHASDRGQGGLRGLPGRCAPGLAMVLGCVPELHAPGEVEYCRKQWRHRGSD
jgi:hypothetical protein